MPSIEIICVEQAEPLQLVGLPFDVYAEKELVSHRTPSPLFQADFDAMSGCIYHIVQQRGGWHAGDLVDWEYLKFKEEFSPHVKELLEVLLQASPVHRLIFTSDYQFGPDDVRRYKRPRTLDKFWGAHDAGKLHFNALYPLKSDSS